MTNMSSDYKRLRKAVRSSSKKTTEPGGPVFTRRGDKIIFKFRHFIDPEQLVEDYIKAHIYDKTRNKEVLFVSNESSSVAALKPKVSSSKHSHEKDTTRVNGCGRKTSARKSSKLHVESWSSNPSTPQITHTVMHKSKQTRRIEPVKRITATHDFVYEFNPLGTSAATRGNKPANLVAINEEYTFSKLGKAFPSNSQSAEAALSKLHSHPNITVRPSEKNLLNRNKSLPNIKQQEKEQSRMQSVKSKSRYTHSSITRDIDRQVEKIKSDWQALRRERGWSRDKNYVPTACSRKVYDTLDKVTRQIDNMQRAYSDPSANQYLQRSAIKALKSTSTVSFEDEAARIRQLLFPKSESEANGTQFSADQLLLDGVDTLQDPSITVDAPKVINQATSPKKRSLLSITQKRTSQKPITIRKAPSTSFNDCRSAETSQAKQIRSKIDQYLNKYIEDAEKSFMDDTKNNIKELEPSPQDVLDILEKSAIYSTDIANILDNDEIIYEKYQQLSQNTVKTNRGLSSGPIDLKAIQSKQSGDENEDKSVEQKTQTSCAQVTETKELSRLGLNEIATNLPDGLLSTIIHSEYLKKDFSLSI